MAAVAGSIAFVLGSGDWSPVTTIIGITLAMVVLAYHRGVIGTSTARRATGRAAFGGVVALSICLAAAWPLQEILVVHLMECTFRPDSGVYRICARRLPLIFDLTAGSITTAFLVLAWAVLAPLLAALEPLFTRRLNATK